MKTLNTMFVVLTSGLLFWALRSDLSGQSPAPETTKERVPVVVELFTSEGCSTCPPADKLVSELDARQPFHTAEVIVIEEHVDYWDQDGWKDPFSSMEWTARQNQYSSVLHTGSSYTPEMIVDGKEGFVGSRGGTAVQEIQKAAAVTKTKVQLSDVQIQEKKSLTFKVNIEKPADATPKDTPEIILAITEGGLHSSVKAGENSGKELQHSQVLRELRVIGKNGAEGFSGQASVKLDSEWKLENLRAVVFLQEKKSRRILGAAAVHLTQQNAALR